MKKRMPFLLCCVALLLLSPLSVAGPVVPAAMTSDQSGWWQWIGTIASLVLAIVAVITSRRNSKIYHLEQYKRQAEDCNARFATKDLVVGRLDGLDARLNHIEANVDTILQKLLHNVE